MKLYLFLFMVFVVGVIFAQDSPSNYRSKKIAVSDTIVLDSVPINPKGFQILDKKGIPLDTLNYIVNFQKGFIVFSDKIINKTDSVTVNYLRYPKFLTRDYFLLDPKIIVENTGDIDKLYTLQESTNKNEFTPFEGLNTLGSISRGITIGNNQNAVVNSELDLQITGKLSEKVSIRASIQDANIPTQEAGYSQSLDEFDQIFIELYSDNWNIRAGDVELQNQKSFFGNFTKKVQGISLRGTLNQGNGAKTTAFASGALVRGVFSRSEFLGQEGNQGPYKLVGPNGELFILIVSGSERVYINGLLLARGENNDYVIDYNAGEIKFNPTYPITANMRITVEYQFTDRNYTRFIGNGGGNYTSDKLDIGVYIYSESDAKNQPLQQNLSEEQVAILKAAGDDITLMTAPSAVPDTFSENKILYKKEILNGIDIFVFSNNPEDELFNVRFTLLGSGMGNYIISDDNAINRIFVFVSPVNGVLQGDYEPIIQLKAPVKIQVGGVNGSYHPSEKTNISFELAGSNNDLNLFSDIDNGDNDGFAGRFLARQTLFKPSDSLKLDAFASIDYINKDFRTIERLYSVEFNRDWNLDPETSEMGNQRFLITGLEFSSQKIGSVQYEYQNLDISENFKGTRHVLGSNLYFGNFKIYNYGSYLESNEDVSDSKFFRAYNTVTYSFNKAWIGGKLNLENNQVRVVANDSLTPMSQKYNSYEIYTGVGDSSKVFVEVGYQFRINDSIRNSVLKKVSTSNTYFLKSRIIKSANAQLSLYANYRKLNDEINSDNDEQFLNSRLLYTQSLLKGGIQINSVLESNNGVIPQQEFTYVKVEPGEGIYVWNDYNNNGIQELEEFDVAQYPDEAEYVRILLPNQVFIKIRENVFSQILTLNPKQWETKEGFRRFLSHFYNQSSYILDRKVRRQNDVFNINPFKDGGDDELGLVKNFRNAFYFNRGKQHFTTNYTYLSSSSRNFLSVGLTENNLESHQLNFNHKVWESWLLNLKASLGSNESISENYASRNFKLDSYDINPKISYLLNAQTRFDIFYKFLNEENLLGEKERLEQQKLGFSFAYSQAQKISIQGEFNYIENVFSGSAFSPVAYQMLEGLQPGTNFTWQLLFQKKITKYLDANFSYFGRKSESTSTVHTGTIQLRAYF
ncbi:MAG: hypothetical protein IIB06_04155 [Bacteroidetes bacterium]|nr:hypothetical protein [Bacteroidota bacterium]